MLPHRLDAQLTALERREPHLRGLIDRLIWASKPDVASTADVLERLRQLKSTRDLFDAVVTHEVTRIRVEYGASWTRIGEVLGLTRQGARKRYQEPEDQERSDDEEIFESEMAAMEARYAALITRRRVEGARAGVGPKRIEADVRRIEAAREGERAELWASYLQPLLTRLSEDVS